VKRSTRQRLVRLALYAVLLVALLVVGSLVDWGRMQANFFSLEGLGPNLTVMILTGVRNTLYYTFVAFLGGLALAFVLALMRLSPVAVYRWLATGYIEFFRGLPSLIVILAMAFGVPIAFGWTPPGGQVGAGLLGLVLVAGAYMAETLRAGIQAVPKGQAEAARSLGMSPGWTMASIVMPQALRIVVPPLTNEFVLLIKDTALLFVIGLAASQRELTTMARDLLTSGPTAGTATSLTLAAILYLAITLPLTRLVAWMESKQNRSR
jgi:polar amino acid transport system permease protein